MSARLISFPECYWEMIRDIGKKRGLVKSNGEVNIQATIRDIVISEHVKIKGEQ